jgi:DnaJ like chaperone protein
MSIWEKLAAAAAELTVGAPISALLGGAAGHHVIDRDQEQDRPEDQVAFTVGVIALGAKMAKAGGVVTIDEVNAFKKAYKVSAAEMKHAARVFNLAKQDVAGYEAYAEQLATMLQRQPQPVRGCARGPVPHRQGRQGAASGRGAVPRAGRQALRFHRRRVQLIKARDVIAAKRNPYDVRVKPSVSNEELKSHYRSLVANHPDKLMARGVPKEFVTIATEKVVTINEAYYAIAKERGI